MARKQLIKGANAARLEERIARVPADLGPKLSPERSIFGAITEMERDENATKTEPKPKPSRRKAAEPKKAKPQEPPPESRPESTQLSRIGPSDFSNAERETIMRCCADYRNRLPIYLLSVQHEVKVIDAVIEKCMALKKKQ